MATESRFELDKSATITLDSAGAGVAEFQVGSNQRWVIRLFNTSGSSSPEPKHRVVRRGNNKQLDYTDRGNGDTSNTEVPLSQGDGIRCEYSGGQSGAIMVFSFQGDLYVKGNRGYGT